MHQSSSKAGLDRMKGVFQFSTERLDGYKSVIFSQNPFQDQEKFSSNCQLIPLSCFVRDTDTDPITLI